MSKTTTLLKVKGKFSLKSKPFWNYKDRRPLLLVNNRLPPLLRRNPHLVMCDRKGTPRFVLGYTSYGKSFVISSIQRVRTAYDFKLGLHPFTKMPTIFEWNPSKETWKSKQFQAELGKHPGEFLLSQFILQNKEAILAGAKVRLNPESGDKKSWEIYGALIDRFFRYSPKNGFELSMEKKRVKELLGLG